MQSIGREWPSGLKRCETPLGARLGLGTQSRYKAPGDLQVEINKNAMINIG